MPLPRNFQFSATSLQAYVDCPRRFQLRYLLQVAWPAPEAEPISEQERHGRLAQDFHRLVHQHLLGLPSETLSASVRDPDLKRWWKAYLAYVPTFGDAQVIPEIGLSAPLAGHRVMAQYDAIVVSDRQSTAQEETPEAALEHRTSFLIIDWKTYRQRPSRVWLGQRLQTRVYPAILVQAGASLTNKLVDPDDVEMRYWLAEYPKTPESFAYDVATYQADLDYLSALIKEIVERASDSGSSTEAVIAASGDEAWPLTTEVRRCRFCNYRSLCERGDVAGPLAEYGGGDDQDQPAADEPDLDFDLDWGQVQEIAY
jgi:hypothetical protein